MIYTPGFIHLAVNFTVLVGILFGLDCFFWVQRINVRFFNIVSLLIKNKLLLTLAVPVPRYAGGNTNLPSNRNISKRVRVNMTFTTTYFKEYLMSFLVISNLIDFAFMVL